jgi:hypothetical protein
MQLVDHLNYCCWGLRLGLDKMKGGACAILEIRGVVP